MNNPGRVRAASRLRVCQQLAVSDIASCEAPSLIITLVAIAGFPICQKDWSVFRQGFDFCWLYNLTALFTPINIKQYFVVAYVQMLLIMIFVAQGPR